MGPHHWLIVVATFLIIFSGLLFWQHSDYLGRFPSATQWLSRVPFVAVIVIYAELLPYVGFALTTPILMTFVSSFFGARLIPAMIAGVVMSAVCFVIFDILLSISLPTGLWIRQWMQ